MVILNGVCWLGVIIVRVVLCVICFLVLILRFFLFIGIFVIVMLVNFSVVWVRGKFGFFIYVCLFLICSL